jgi:hypothetical protein
MPNSKDLNVISIKHYWNGNFSRNFNRIISVARGCRPEDREFVLSLLEHAEHCELCTRDVIRQGFKSVSSFRDYLKKEWAISTSATP